MADLKNLLNTDQPIGTSESTQTTPKIDAYNKYVNMEYQPAPYSAQDVSRSQLGGLIGAGLGQGLSEVISRKINKIRENKEIDAAAPYLRKYFKDDEQLKAFTSLLKSNKELGKTLFTSIQKQYEDEQRFKKQQEASAIKAQLEKEAGITPTGDLEQTQTMTTPEGTTPEGTTTKKTVTAEELFPGIKNYKDEISAWDQEIADAEANIRRLEIAKKTPIVAESAKELESERNRIDKALRDARNKLTIAREKKADRITRERDSRSKDINNTLKGLTTTNKELKEEIDSGYKSAKIGDEALSNFKAFEKTENLDTPLMYNFVQWANKFTGLDLSGLLLSPESTAYGNTVKMLMGQVRDIFGGRINEYEVRIIENALPNLAKSKEARELIYEVMRHTNEIKKARKYAYDDISAKAHIDRSTESILNYANAAQSIDKEIEPLVLKHKQELSDYLSRYDQVQKQDVMNKLSGITPEYLKSQGAQPGDEITVDGIDVTVGKDFNLIPDIKNNNSSEEV